MDAERAQHLHNMKLLAKTLSTSVEDLGMSEAEAEAARARFFRIMDELAAAAKAYMSDGEELTQQIGEVRRAFVWSME